VKFRAQGRKRFWIAVVAAKENHPTGTQVPQQSAAVAVERRMGNADHEELTKSVLGMHGRHSSKDRQRGKVWKNAYWTSEIEVCYLHAR
jgi:hypothetical protein